MLALSYLTAWINPYFFGDNSLSNLSGLIVLEIVLLFAILVIYVLGNLSSSSTLMSQAFAAFYFCIFSAGYLMVLFVSYYLGKQIFIFIFLGWFIFFSKYMTVKSSLSSGESGVVAQFRVYTMLSLCAVSAWVAAYLPVPELGFTGGITDQKTFILFSSEPYRIMAMGFFYFGGTVLSELYISIATGK